jgi:ligand-binding sensor domain-containing protein/serine phosphatase RsbU (regulator of sigma subunit)
LGWGYNSGSILLIFLILQVNHAFSQDYNYRNFNTEDGLPQSFIYSVVQDDKGYLWVGTGNGLSRFNGFEFENFTVADSLADNFITCGISVGECLWFGHMNGRLSYFDGRKFQKINAPQSSHGPVTHMAVSPDGSIWASTYSGIFYKLDREEATVSQKSFTEQVSVVTFAFINSEELIVGTNAGLLYCRLNGSGEIEIIRTIIEIPESRISGIQKDKETSVYFIATENDGIYNLLFGKNKVSVSEIVIDPDNTSHLSGIQDIFQDSKSDIWIASFGAGLIKLKYSLSAGLSGTGIFNKPSGFPSDNIKTVFEDREGNIWSGNYGDGLTMVTPKTFSVYTFNNPLFGNNIFSICFNGEFKWVGTENGLIKTDVNTGEVIRLYDFQSGLPKDTVTSLYCSENEDIWIGTGKNGLFRIEAGDDLVTKYLLDNEGALENSVTAITGKGNQIWVGTKKGLCNINQVTGSINWYSIFKGGLPHNYINSLFYDSSDKLWVTTRSNTLAYIQNEKVIKIPLNVGRGILILRPLAEDLNSRIWVGSNGNGVFLIESDSVINLTVKEGLLSNYCYSMICDDNANVWVGHKGGLSKIRTTDFLVKPVQYIENVTDSYQFNPNAIIKDPDKRIWFGTDKGMISYDPSFENKGFLPPVLGITSLKINDEEIDLNGKIVLPPGSYKIRIDFLGISLKEPSLVSYQYILEGYDRWSEITKSTSITYNNLTEGSYTFLLNSSSGDGAVTEIPLKISILINTPAWKKWWFYFVIVLVVAILSISYVMRREYKLLAEKKILEEKVIERTQEIQVQKNEIELQRDMIEEKNTNITASIKYASHIQNAVLPPLELINRLLPENFVLFRPKDIVSGDFFWIAEKDGKVVFTVADCTGHGVPGAFMSFLGITLLNSIVNIQGVTDADRIVMDLRERIIHSLQQSRKESLSYDGMDIALCVLDPRRNVIQYTGGMSNLVYIRDGKLEVIKADRFSVCYSLEEPCPFKMHEIELKKGDVFYLFSDGYKDQFGGEFDKKYLVPHFHLALLESHKLPMQEQKAILEGKLIEWMKNTEQTDDVTVMGIRI